MSKDDVGAAVAAVRTALDKYQPMRSMTRDPRDHEGVAGRELLIALGKAVVAIGEEL